MQPKEMNKRPGEDCYGESSPLSADGVHATLVYACDGVEGKVRHAPRIGLVSARLWRRKAALSPSPTKYQACLGS